MVASLFIFGFLSLAQSCRSCMFSLVKRDGNSVAHALPRFSKSVSDNGAVWLDGPIQLEEVLNFDVIAPLN